jgi:hypothetical protein
VGYDVDTDTFPTGRRDVGVPSDPNADHHLTVRSDRGDVTLRDVP